MSFLIRGIYPPGGAVLRVALHLGLVALPLPLSAPASSQTSERRTAIRDRFDIGEPLERNACDTDKDRISTGDAIEVCVRKRKPDTRHRLLPLPKTTAPVDSLASDRHRSIAAESPCVRDGHAGCPAAKIIIFSTTFQ